MLYTPMTRKAMTLACEAHHGRKDRSGVPCIFHPARVAAGFTNEAEACVAWLRDAMEDARLTIAGLRVAGFGAAVCDALQPPTRGRAVPYMDCSRRIASDPIAGAVRLADLRDNMDVSRLDVIRDGDKARLEKHATACRLLSDA